tara:strand:- start:27642 stop:27995 length:354 start_codon:yes stop_codon:yes gene_type:complete
MLLSQASFAQNVNQDDVIWVKDWRLEKPFVHGFIGAISLNQVSLFPEEWTQAQKNEPNGMAPGAVAILERNKTIPFVLGVITGGIFLLLISLAIYRSYKYRHVVRYFKKAMAEHDAL